MTSPTPPSPQAPTLHLPTLSRLLLWRVRGSWNAAGGRHEHDGQEGSCPEAEVATFVSGSSRRKPVKRDSIECCSGKEFMTHARLADAHSDCRRSDVIVHQELFECLNGVDTRLLLLLARRRVFEKVELLGGNAIIDERWSCTICKHTTRRGVLYRISITYQGTPARCGSPDPQRPVAVEEAKSIPGLMTVVSRQWKIPRLY